MDVSEAAVEQQRSHAVMPVIAVLIIALTVLVAFIAYNTHRLVVEQQRSTCFARLAWISPGAEDQPEGVERSTAARFCEGSSPLIKYEDQG